MRIDSVLLFLLMLRYVYEKNPLRYAIMRGIIEQFPTVLPEQCRTPSQMIQLIDTILTPHVSTSDNARHLREFAARFL